MKTRNSKTTRKITMLLSAIMLSEQLASTGAVLYAHAEDVTPAEYTIVHNVTSSWDGGCSAEIILTNQAEVDTENWSVTFCTRDEITNLWGGKIMECEELLVSDASVEMDDVTDAEEVSEMVEETESDETEIDEVETEEAVAEETTEEESTEKTEEVEEAEEETDTAEEVEEVSEDEEDAVEEETEEALEEELLEEELLEEETEEEVEEESEEEDNLYYRYTVEALDYNAVIPAGGSITIGYNVNGEDHEIWDAQAEIVLKEVEVEEERNPEGNIYEGDGYTVEVVIPAYWDGAYNVQLPITNTSEETLHNWAFVMATKDFISNLYNAVELSDKDGVRLIKNAGYNQDIPAGGTVEVGYTANYDGDFDVPVDFALSQIEKEVTTAECEVSLFVTEEWENGGLAEIILTNISELPIEDWMLEFDSTLEIEEMWGGVIENHEGEHYFIRNAEYAQNIVPGESWTIGMLFSGDAADMYLK